MTDPQAFIKHQALRLAFLNNVTVKIQMEAGDHFLSNRRHRAFI
jgi:hypothetical protein